VSYSGRSQSAITDQNGNYQLSVPPGTYGVSAGVAGYQSASQSNILVTSNSTTPNVNFALTPLGNITGVVKNSSGTPIAGATMSYGGGSTSTATDGS
jgi:Carboxypeptidase regulatory-like domain